jgi:hypothetical protein
MPAQVKLAVPAHAVNRTDRWSAPITRLVHLLPSHRVVAPSLVQAIASATISAAGVSR